MEDRPPPPNLNDPAELAAYRLELRGVARGVRFGAIAITLLGAAVALLRVYALPSIPVIVPLVVLALGLLLMLTAIALRTAYHAQRMRG